MSTSSSTSMMTGSDQNVAPTSFCHSPTGSKVVVELVHRWDSAPGIDADVGVVGDCVGDTTEVAVVAGAVVGSSETDNDGELEMLLRLCACVFDIKTPG